MHLHLQQNVEKILGLAGAGARCPSFPGAPEPLGEEGELTASCQNPKLLSSSFP
jgi:hypothetical protein